MEMDREYKSKVDWWYHLVVILLGMMTVISFVKGWVVFPSDTQLPSHS